MLTPMSHHACTRRGIVKQIDMRGIDMVFVVGGNGGNAGANAIQCECEEQGVVCSVIGIPKSIDNDILLVQLCTLSFASSAPRCWSLPSYANVTA